jgi:hypothetical protein
MSENTWDVFCDYLKTHPSLQVLDLGSRRRFLPPLAPLHLKVRGIQSLVDMLKVNTSILTIHLDGHYFEHELFQRLVIPYLDSNRLRPRVHAIQNTRPIAYRAKVLGRALLAMRTDPNSFWMIYQGMLKLPFRQRLRRRSRRLRTSLRLLLPLPLLPMLLLSPLLLVLPLPLLNLLLRYISSSAAAHVANPTHTADRKRQARPWSNQGFIKSNHVFAAFPKHESQLSSNIRLGRTQTLETAGTIVCHLVLSRLSVSYY